MKNTAGIIFFKDKILNQEQIFMDIERIGYISEKTYRREAILLIEPLDSTLKNCGYRNGLV